MTARTLNVVNYNSHSPDDDDVSTAPISDDDACILTEKLHCKCNTGQKRV